MDSIRLGVEPNGARWSVTHNGGYLGHVHTREEALGIARMLAAWSDANGRPAEVDPAQARAERRSFAMADAEPLPGRQARKTSA